MCIKTDREGGGNEKTTSKFGIYEIRGTKLVLQGAQKLTGRPWLLLFVIFKRDILVMLTKCRPLYTGPKCVHKQLRMLKPTTRILVGAG
jgi:hypothetical protein